MQFGSRLFHFSVFQQLSIFDQNVAFTILPNTWQPPIPSISFKSFPQFSLASHLVWSSNVCNSRVPAVAPSTRPVRSSRPATVTSALSLRRKATVQRTVLYEYNSGRLDTFTTATKWSTRHAPTCHEEKLHLNSQFPVLLVPFQTSRS